MEPRKRALIDPRYPDFPEEMTSPRPMAEPPLNPLGDPRYGYPSNLRDPSPRGFRFMGIDVGPDIINSPLVRALLGR